MVEIKLRYEYPYSLSITQMELISQLAGCKPRTVGTAAKELRSIFEEEKKNLIDLKKEEKRELKNKKVKGYKLVAVIPKAQWQDFVEFVGFRGYYDNGKAVIDHSFRIEKLIINDKAIETKVWTYPYHPGEAIPAPIDEMTGEEIGILWYQLEGFLFIELHDNILILWARAHGKTWLLAWYIEWNMKHCKYKCMYLSITGVIDDVADWVFDWADLQGYLTSGTKKLKGSRAVRRDTPISFSLKNGSKFKIFSVKDKKIRGKHGYTVFMDDVVEEGSETKPSYQIELQRRWNKTLKFMRRNKLVIVNTRVYMGDFIEFLMDQFATQYEIMRRNNPQDADKWKLHLDLRTPYMKGKDGDVIDDEGFLLDVGKRVLIAPELYNHAYFDSLIAADKPSFMAEMMQDPSPLAGKRWKSVAYDSELKHMNNYEYMFFYVDRAFTAKTTSDYTGFLQGVREYTTGIRTIINDFTDHWTLEQLAFIISKKVDLWHRQYEHMGIILIMEQQGGGDDFDAQISTRNHFTWHEDLEDTDEPNPFGYRVGETTPNFIRHLCHRHLETSKGEKKKRIQDRLGAPIDNKVIRFLLPLKNSEVVLEVLDHPYNNKLDAIDALSFDHYLMEYYPITSKGWAEDIVDAIISYEQGRIEDKHTKDTRLSKVLALGNKQHARRTVFQ